MLTRDQAAAIFDKLRKYSSADEIELLISSGQSALTRFANNTIHQNVTEENHALCCSATILRSRTTCTIRYKLAQRLMAKARRGGVSS